MTDYQAPHEDWDAVETTASHGGNNSRLNYQALRCILELRAKVHALEADNQAREMNDTAAYDQLAARVEAIEDGNPCRYIRRSDEGTSYCALAELSAAKGSDHIGQVNKMVAGALVESVAGAIKSGYHSDARAAIRKVVAHIRANVSPGPSTAAGIAVWLEQEAAK